MQSMFSRWMGQQIKVAKRLMSQMDVTISRAAQDKIGSLYARVISSAVEYTPAEGWCEDVAAWAVPKDNCGEGAVLYLHGGGYVAGSLSYSKLFGGALAYVGRKKVFCLGYSLAPEYPYPAALNDALRAYEYLLERFPAERIALVGESAGGGLILCLTHLLKQRGIALPRCVVPISPWSDLTMSGKSYVYNKDCDVNLTIEHLQYFVTCYGPLNLRDELVSPAFGDFGDFPPALMFASGDEILLDDARMVHRKYLAAGRECRLIIASGMWHAYPLYPVPEGERAKLMIGEFIKKHIGE